LEERVVGREGTGESSDKSSSLFSVGNRSGAGRKGFARSGERLPDGGFSFATQSGRKRISVGVVGVGGGGGGGGGGES